MRHSYTVSHRKLTPHSLLSWHRIPLTTTTPTSLKAKGVDYQDGKLSITSNRRFDREQEIDATQRSLINSMKAASFGKADDAHKLPVMERQSSMSSARVSVHEVDPEEKEKKSRLRKKA